MELRLILRVLRRYWWLVFIPTAITAAAALPGLLSGSSAAGSFTTVIRYSAAQRPDAQPPRDGDYQDIWLASEYTVNALTGWVQTASFRREIAQLVGDSAAVASLSIAADNQRSIGQLFLSHPDADRLAVLVEAAVEVLRTRNGAYFPQVGSAPADVTLLDDPVIVPAPPPLTNRFAPLLRVGIALFAGVGLAFLAHYLDPTLRQRDDLEALGVPVVGTLPRE